MRKFVDRENRKTKSMTDTSELVVGVDLGTQGVRIIITDARGCVVAQTARALPVMPTTADGTFEQDPEQWWIVAADGLRAVMTHLADHTRLQALTVVSTSGTLCFLDMEGNSVRPAIMYSDQRAQNEAALFNHVGNTLISRVGYRFNASFSLPKLLWVQRHEPHTFAATRFFAHAADLLVGRLTGEHGVSDWSHALKSGYDLIEECWPDFIDDKFGLPGDRFPQIVPPGTLIGQVTPAAAAMTGLPSGLRVIAGMTDGCAAQIAGGANEPGQWLSVLGTTLGIKGVTTELLRDPQGRIYSHRHPTGIWLPGGASNTGGEVLAHRFGGVDLTVLDRQAEAITPSGLVSYPLERVGERFPFINPQARGFVLGTTATPEAFYTACLEGVGYLERLAYATLAALGAPIEEPIRMAGGGARSHVWLQIRANILNRPLVVPRQTEAAFGAAILAASASLHPDLISATRAMVHLDREITPQPDTSPYEEAYARFLVACYERGYLASPNV